MVVNGQGWRGELRGGGERSEAAGGGWAGGREGPGVLQRGFSSSVGRCFANVTNVCLTSGWGKKCLV